jgi:anthranilate synthase
LAEEAETELKASAMIDAIIRKDLTDLEKDQENNLFQPSTSSSQVNSVAELIPPSSKRQVLLIDHEDSFVHTLANYLRQMENVEVVTCRSGKALTSFIEKQIDTQQFIPKLVVLSPGPGNPTDFQLSQTIELLIQRKLPIFGVCLGLQGLVEYFGGELGILSYPMHGKPSTILRKYSDHHLTDTTTISSVTSSSALSFDILQELPDKFQVARYHSLYAKLDTFPFDKLIITATTEDDVVMAIQHIQYPIAAVQFHPESILTLPKHGLKIIENALRVLDAKHYHV